MKIIFDRQKFGPWALITGASSGIGKEFSKQLASFGLNLILVARRLPLLEEIGQQLSKQYDITYRTVEADLSKESSIKKIIDATSDLDVGLLVSNAGTGKAAKFLSLEEEEQKQFVQLNALSHFSLTHYYGRKLANRRQGGVLLTGAMGAADGVPYMASMAGSKALLLSLGKSLHTEFEKTGVNITVLITPPTDTPIISKLGFDKKTMPMKPITAEQCAREALEALSLNRVTVMPGLKFRIATAIIPPSISRKITGDLMKKNNGID